MIDNYHWLSIVYKFVQKNISSITIILLGLVFTLLTTTASHAQDAKSTPYRGFRIYVAHSQLGKVTPAATKVNFTLINTGRKPVLLLPAAKEKMIIGHPNT